MEEIISQSHIQHFKKLIDKFMDKHMKCIGVTKLEGLYLGTLMEHDGTSLVELTNLVHFDKANTTRVINDLENKGYVIRKTNEKDSRKYKIYLTEKAKALGVKIKEYKDKFREIALQGVSKEELNTLTKVINTIFNNLSKI